MFHIGDLIIVQASPIAIYGGVCCLILKQSFNVFISDQFDCWSKHRGDIKC